FDAARFAGLKCWSERGKIAEEIRVGLGYARGIPDPDAFDPEPRHRERHRDPMVVVSLDHRGLKPRRLDQHPVLAFVDVCAEARELGGERADTVALVMADESDGADARWRGAEGRYRGEGRHHVGHRVHRDVNPVELAGAAYLDALGAPSHPRAHPLEQTHKFDIAL